MIRISVGALSVLAAAMVAAPAWGQAQQPAKPASNGAAKPQASQPAKPKPTASKPAEAKPAASTFAEARTSRTAAANAQAAVPPSQPTLLGQYGDWGAYTAAPSGRKICFVFARPASAKTDPPNRPRDQPYFFISTRPSEKVRDEISTMVGYPLKPDSANAVVGGSTFAMYAQNDGAWIKNAAEESKAVEALRKSGELVVKGVSSRGTETTDTYNLRGLSQALDRASQECRG
jgi:hypothetical protein